MMRESEVFCSPVETGEKQKYNISMNYRVEHA
jgi:hypothetical protein